MDEMVVQNARSLPARPGTSMSLRPKTPLFLKDKGVMCVSPVWSLPPAWWCVRGRLSTTAHLAGVAFEPAVAWHVPFECDEEKDATVAR